MHPSVHFPSLSWRWLVVVIGAWACVLLGARATEAKGELKHSDRVLLEKVAKAGQKEIQLSQIAAERASNPRIREYAQMIVNDYQQISRDLSALAASKGVALTVNEFKLEKWSAKKTAEFDRDYVDEMADEHDDTISRFEKAAKSDDADIAAFAQRYLPKLQAHDTAAKDFKKMY